MESEKKKRTRPIPTSSQRSKKRQKINPIKVGVQTDVKKIPIALDALPWNEVEMPDMFEDAEGFFGLEEVDDVEVVREGNTVEFVSTKSQNLKVQTDINEEDFEGFKDNESIIPTGRPAEKNPIKAIQPKKERNKKAKKQLCTPPKKDSISVNLEKNVFSALKDEATQEETDVSAWEELDLSSESLSSLAKLGFSIPTPIQRASIPKILAGHDVIGKASTGSGKTLAFGIPLLESWLGDHRYEDISDTVETKTPTALILSPTRELAHQITEHITALCAGLSDAPYVATVTGGLSVQKQQRQLLRADIIVGTPGRLWEVMSSSIELSASFKKIKFLVVDEADRLLTEGHFKEAEEILNSLDREVDGNEDEDFLPSRQTLVFSATFHQGLQQKLAGKGKQGLMDKNQSMEYLLKKLNFREDKPKFIDVNPISQMAAGLKEGMVECAGPEKDLYLYALLLHHPNQRILIFTNSIYSVRRLVPLLANLNLPAYALHSQMPQKARLRSLERFSATSTAPNPSTCSILVATDVAARGLDIPAVHLIIHYHLPRSADTYVHRSGRSARAGFSGSSILLCAPEEVVATRRLVAKVHSSASSTASSKSKFYIRSLDLDRKLVARLKERVALAKKIADSILAKEKGAKADEWMRHAAEELGVYYDGEELKKLDKGKAGGRKIREQAARDLSKSDVAGLRAELRELLSRRINVGVSERYLTAGGVVDIGELLGVSGATGLGGGFLGKVSGVFDD